MTNRRKTIYVTDLDGTLLDNSARLSARARHALASMLEEGLKLTVATARSVVSVQPILRDLPIPLPVVDQNGAFVSDLASGKHLLTRAIEGDLAADVYAIMGEGGCVPFISSFDGMSDRLYYSDLGNPGMQWYADDRRRHRDRRLCRTEELSRALSEQVMCLTAIDSPAAIEQLASAVASRFGSELTIRRFPNEYFAGWDWLTVHDGRAGKDKAVEWLLSAFGFGDVEVVAFGDGDSDVPLFRLANRGIAVSNATSGLLSLATEVIGPNCDDSVVAYIEREWRS